MEVNTDIFPALEQITRPAFTVESGKITAANTAAQSRQFLVGTDISHMLETVHEEFEAMSDGQLSFVLHCNDISYDTTVIRQGQDTLFVFNSEYEHPELKALSLAALHLREPLNNAMNSTDQLLPKEAIQTDPELHRQLLQINRNLHQLHRAICNMADTAKYQRLGAVAMEFRDVIQILSEILEKASTLLSSSGKALEYTLPKETVYTLVNEEMLERSLLNLISNATKQSNGFPVHVAVRRTDKNVCITVSNRCLDKKIANLFNRYLRQPEIEDGKNGIGLGLTIVRGAAYAHKGTVLTQQQNDMLQVTMSLRIQSSTDKVLRTPIQLPYDYAGCRDHTLIELSDVLTENVYDQK